MDTVPLICTKPVLLSLLHSFAFYFFSLSFCTITSHLAPLVIIVAADLSMFPSGVAVPYQWFFFLLSPHFSVLIIDNAMQYEL